MYLFIDNFEIKNKSYKKQVLRPSPWCSAVIRALFQCSNMIGGGPGVIRCSVSAPFAIRCSVAPGPLINVLLDAFSHRQPKLANGKA